MTRVVLGEILSGIGRCACGDREGRLRDAQKKKMKPFKANRTQTRQPRHLATRMTPQDNVHETTFPTIDFGKLIAWPGPKKAKRCSEPAS